jgi:hypothetical protein
VPTAESSITRIANYQWRNWYLPGQFSFPFGLWPCLTVAHARPPHRAGIHTATPKYLYKPTSAREIVEVLATCVTTPLHQPT